MYSAMLVMPVQPENTWVKLVTAVLFLKSATLAPVRLVHDEKHPSDVVTTVHVENAMRELKFPRANLETKHST